MNQPQATPPMRIWQVSLGFANTSVLHALVKTGVIEQMRRHPKTLPELADACQLNTDVLQRVLRFAAVIDVVVQCEGQYSLTETGKLLLKDVPGSLYAGILLVGSEPWQCSWRQSPPATPPSTRQWAWHFLTTSTNIPNTERHIISG